MTFHRLLSRTASIRAAASQSARVAATQPAQVLERTPTSVFRSLKKSMSRSKMEVDSIQERRGSRSDSENGQHEPRRIKLKKTVSIAMAQKEEPVSKWQFLRNKLDRGELRAPTTHWFPIEHEDQSQTPAQLTVHAHTNMRCIEWENISLQLLTTSGGGGTTSGALEINNPFALSRPIRKGEIVDFFMSHSWYDDPEIKFEKLSKLCESFKHRQGRFPTFWLDKVCIDQQNIGGGLKALPINVMACRKMLVLVGPTYPTRLWCAWELCTLLSFISTSQAMERMELVPLDQVRWGSG